ncbi:MAG: hypothetical protein ACR2MM_09635 [Flavobacteriaceae bacterium]
MGKKSKNDGFKTPEGYFEGLSDDLLGKLNKESSVIPKSAGFKSPEGYFDSLDQEILEKLDDRDTKVVKLYPYRKMLFAAASVAAIVLIVIGLQWQGNQSLNFGDIANLELEEYFDHNATGLSSYEIAEVLPVEELELSDILDSDWNEENIVDYLDETIDDIDELNLNNDE